MKIKQILFNLDDILASISLLAVVILTILGVIFRYVFNAPIQFVEEVSTSLIVWVIFMGASSAMKRDSHIGIDIFVDELNPKFKKIFSVLALLITKFALIILIIYGYQLAGQAGLKVTPLLKVPYTYIDLAVPMGCFYMLVHLAVRLFRIIRDKPIDSDIEVDV